MVIQEEDVRVFKKEKEEMAILRTSVDRAFGIFSFLARIPDGELLTLMDDAEASPSVIPLLPFHHRGPSV